MRAERCHEVHCMVLLAPVPARVEFSFTWMDSAAVQASDASDCSVQQHGLVEA
jgi:hypothetical protein